MDTTGYGVINEQGYPAGQFGFSPLNEQDKKALEEDAKKKAESEKKDKE
jgi:hypothetical protein